MRRQPDKKEEKFQLIHRGRTGVREWILEEVGLGLGLEG